MKELSLFAKGAGITLGGFLFSKLFGYVYSVLLARTLGPADLGVFSIATAVLGFAVMFANIGLPFAVSRHVAFYGSRGEDGKVNGTIKGSLIVNVLSSLIFSIAMFFSADFIAVGIYKEPNMAIVLKMLSLIVPLATVGTTFIFAIIGKKQIKYRVYVRNFIDNIGKILFYGAFLLFGFRLFGAAAALVLSYFVSMAFAFYFLQKKVYPFIGTKIKAKYNFSELLNFSWPLLAASFFLTIFTSIDSFMLGYFVDTAAVGIYSIAGTLARLLFIGYSSMSVLFLPIATGFFALEKREELGKFYKTATRWAFSISIPLLFFFLVFSREMIVAFYGLEYATGYLALIVLSLGFFVTIAVGETQHLLKVIGKTRYELFNTLVAATANIALNFVLIPAYGLLGAAIATAIAYVIWNLIGLAEVFFELRVHPYTWTYLKPIAAVLVATLAMLFVSQLVVIESLLMLIVTGIVFMGFYFLLLLLLKGFESEDIELLKLVAQKTGLMQIGFLANIGRRFI